MMAYAAWSVVFGEQPSAAKWNILGTNDSSFNDGTGIANIEIGSGHTSVKNDYKFSVYRNAALNSSNSATVVTMDTKTFDTGSNVDVVTNKGRFTAPIAGFYWFNASCSNSGAITGTMATYLYKNGSLAIQGAVLNNGASTDIFGSTVSGILQLAQNDYIEPYFQGGSGNAIGVGSQYCYFQGFIVSQT